MLNKRTKFQQIKINKKQYMVVKKTITEKDFLYDDKSLNTRTYKTLTYRKPK